jgi:hypothetical protein
MLLSENEARKRINALPRGNQPGIKWAGFDLPGEVAEGNLLVVGAIGSGKTLMHRELMRSVVPSIHPGSFRKALVYDAKCDLLSSLFAMPLASEVLIFNPFDKRSVAWDLAADVQTQAQARNLAESLIRPQWEEEHPYFMEAAREMLTDVINWLNLSHPGNWDLRRLIHITGKREKLTRVLSRSGYNEYQLPESGYANIQATVMKAVLKLKPVASLWGGTRRRISLRHWARHEESILVLESKVEQSAHLQPIYNAAFKIISTTILSEQNTPAHSRFGLFCDDLTTLGLLDPISTMLNARSKGVRCALVLRDVEGLAAKLHSAGTAEEIVNRCATVSWLKLSSAETAAWASRRCGEAVGPSEFLNLPSYSSGEVSGIHLIRNVGGVFKSTARYEFARTTTADFEARSRSDEILPPWNASDDEWLNSGL